MLRSLKRTPVIADEVRTADGHFVHPRDLVDNQARGWHELWAPSSADDAEIDSFWAELRDFLGEGDVPQLDTDSLRRAFRKMRPRTGRGVDQLRPADNERLPDEALMEHITLYEHAEQVGSWPWQLLLVTAQMLGKKSGGERAIGLLSMVSRVWGLARESSVQQRSAAFCPAWNAAIQGNPRFLRPSSGPRTRRPTASWASRMRMHFWTSRPSTTP